MENLWTVRFCKPPSRALGASRRNQPSAPDRDPRSVFSRALGSALPHAECAPPRRGFGKPFRIMPRIAVIVQHMARELSPGLTQEGGTERAIAGIIGATGKLLTI